MRSAGELYCILTSYKRFNQKYNMTRQGFWNEETRKLREKLIDNQRGFSEKGRRGYTLRDRAFLIGAGANLDNTGFVINRPNKDGNAWNSALEEGLRKAPLVADQRTDKTFGRWPGTPSDNIRLLHRVGRRFGADIVGFCHLDRRWVYSHWFDEETKKDYPLRFSDEPGLEEIDRPTQLEDGTQVIPEGMKYVVVLIHEMAEDAMATSPTLIAFAETQLAYSKISFTTVAVAEFIRGLGFHAIPSANCTALNIPLAVDAGLGQLGRNAKLINPRFGPRCRISKVITDLPVAVNMPMDFGVTEFCNQCQKCARLCPIGAIPLGDRSFEPVNECNQAGVLQWQVDHKKCYAYWAEVGTNCGICIRVCPFNKGPGKIHDVTRWFIKHLRIIDPFFVKLDDIMGYGKYHPADKFWDTIEDENIKRAQT